MTVLLKKIHSIIFYGLWLFYYILLYPFLWLGTLKKEWHIITHFSNKILGNIVLLSGLIFIHKKQKTKLDSKKVYIFCPNHTSYADVLVCYAVLPVKQKYLGKLSLTKIPLFGLIFKRVHITVDRKDKTDGAKSFLKCIQAIDDGYNLVIFPEGTISNCAPQLVEFKDGPFLLAIQKKIPIVPITFLDNWSIYPDNKKFQTRPGISRMIIHDPIETDCYESKDCEKLKLKTKEIINNDLILYHGRRSGWLNG